MAQADEAALERARESYRQTTEALVRNARAITDAAAAEVHDKDVWEPLREKRREEMREMLGLLPWPERTPLKAHVTGTIDRGAYVIEKLSFESMPRIYVTANLYRPKQLTGKVPAVIYVCGHAYSPYGDKTKYQRHGISLAKNGYVALVLDSLQIAETFALHHGVASQQMPDWYARGYSPAGVEVWNAMRAIDYLETRPEVDANRIGMTGRSGGAAMTWFTAAVDPRVKVAIPVMGISTYAANLAANTQRHHCDCMFLVNSLRHGLLHQGALIAPRPLLMAHGKLDVLFPVPGYEEFERVISGLYGSYGHPERFRNIVVNTAHKDSDYLREQAIRWFDRFLLEQPDRQLDLEYEELPGAQLAVFPDGPPADAENYRIHERFPPTPAFQKYRSLAQWKQHRAELMEHLRTRVFRNFPAVPSALEPTTTRAKQEGYFQELEFTSEPGIRIRALIHHPDPEDAPKKGPAVLYVASDGEDPAGLSLMFRRMRGPDPVVRMVVYPRGVGEIGWTSLQQRDLLRNAMQTGQTTDSLRLWDVLRAAELLRADSAADPHRVTVMGKGTAGILGLYAALLDTGINQVFLLNPPSTHRAGPIFLNVLRYLDIPEAAALLAPRRLNFYSRVPPAYNPARAIYTLYGVPTHFFLTMDLHNIVEGHYDHNFAAGL